MNLILKANIATIEKKLEFERNQLNETIYKNKHLRNQIDEYRLDKTAQKQSLSTVADTLYKTSRETEEQYDKVAQESERDIQQKEKIEFLRSKSAKQRTRYDEKISTLLSFLRSGNNKSNILNEEKNYSVHSIEVITILKNFLKSCEKKTSEGKRNIEQYVKHINYLVSGFNQIKTATGIHYIEEIVTSCIKAEEQSQAILCYFNNLNNEIDILEDTLKFNKSKIEALESSKCKGEISTAEYIQKNEVNFNLLLHKIKDRQDKLSSLTNVFEKILTVIIKTYKTFNKMNGKAFVNQEIDIDIIDKLNQENADLLLGQIEEFINYLLVIIASKNCTPFSLYPKLNKENQYILHQKTNIIQDLLQDNDLYNEPEFEEIKNPISLLEMKQKAQGIFTKRRNMIKRKSHTPETQRSRTPITRIQKEAIEYL